MAYTSLVPPTEGVALGRRRLRAAFDEPMAMLRLAVPIMLIALVEAHHLGITGVWTGLTVGTAVTSGRMLTRLSRHRQSAVRR